MVNVSQIVTIDRTILSKRAGQLDAKTRKMVAELDVDDRDGRIVPGGFLQVMLDVADRIYPRRGTDAPPARLMQMATNVVVFAIGCGVAALLYTRLSVWCFVVPPVVAAVALTIRLIERAKETS